MGHPSADKTWWTAVDFDFDTAGILFSSGPKSQGRNDGMTGRESPSCPHNRTNRYSLLSSIRQIRRFLNYEHEAPASGS